jgi:hypothetical protein
MATRAPLREDKGSRAEHESHHGLLDWAEETRLAVDGESGEGVPWHFVLLVILALGLLFSFETALVFAIAKLVTGHAY